MLRTKVAAGLFLLLAGLAAAAPPSSAEGVVVAPTVAADLIAPAPTTTATQPSVPDNARVVNPDQVYTYDVLTADLQALQATYPGLIQIRSIGTTVYGREIWAVGLGTGPATVFLNGSHHAREWLSTTLLMYMLEEYARSGGDLLARTTLWFVPMVNPDGVTLQQLGLSAFPPEVRPRLLELNGGSDDFRHWKANAEGIDLNHQYPAGWDHVGGPAAAAFANYKGTAPLQAAEAQAVAAFTYAIDPEITVSYHSSGRILYWHYRTKAEHLDRDQRLAGEFARITGYSLVEPTPGAAGGGYKDWFIQEFGRPGFTPELGAYVHEDSLPLWAFAEEWERNRTIGRFVAEEGYKLWAARQQTEKTAVSSR